MAAGDVFDPYSRAHRGDFRFQEITGVDVARPWIRSYSSRTMTTPRPCCPEGSEFGGATLGMCVLGEVVVVGQTCFMGCVGASCCGGILRGM